MLKFERHSDNDNRRTFDAAVLFYKQHISFEVFQSAWAAGKLPLYVLMQVKKMESIRTTF